MRKEIKKRIKEVWMHLGAKKQSVTVLRDESEGMNTAFINAGELPPIVQASPEIQARFNAVISVEKKIDIWFEQKLIQVSETPILTPEILNEIHVEAIGFINEIDQI
jgi:hypothetical protein